MARVPLPFSRRTTLCPASCSMETVRPAKGQKDIAFFHLEGMPENREFNVVYLKGTHVQRLVRDVLGAAP